MVKLTLSIITLFRMKPDGDSRWRAHNKNTYPSSSSNGEAVSEKSIILERGLKGKLHPTDRPFWISALGRSKTSASYQIYNSGHMSKAHSKNWIINLNTKLHIYLRERELPLLMGTSSLKNRYQTIFAWSRLTATIKGAYLRDPAWSTLLQNVWKCSSWQNGLTHWLTSRPPNGTNKDYDISFSQTDSVRSRALTKARGWGCGSRSGEMRRERKATAIQWRRTCLRPPEKNCFKDKQRQFTKTKTF